MTVRTNAATERSGLLQTVRRLFVVFFLLLLLVECIEWLDADTAVWPQRSVAALGLVVAAAWAIAIYRRAERLFLLDLVLLGAFVATGWGLGRPGAVLALLVGALNLRSLHGSRRSVAASVSLLIAAYAGVTILVEGLGDLLTLGTVTVIAAAAAIASVIHRLGQALERHDLSATWNRILTDAAEKLNAGPSIQEIDQTVGAALVRIADTIGEGQASLWRGDDMSLHRVDLGGPARDDTPTELDLGSVDRDLLEHITTGDAIELQGGLLQATLRDLDVESTSRWVVVAPQVLANRFRGVLVVSAKHRVPPELVDTLQRLAADAALAIEREESDRRFRVLAENSRDGIYLLQVRPTPEWLYLNPAARELLMASPQDDVPTPNIVFDRIAADDRYVLGRLRKEEGVVSEPTTFRLTGPDHRWVEVHEQVAETGADDRVIVQGVVRDVTHQRRHENAMRKALEHEAAAADRLRDLDEMKTAFLQAVSHELRTPLTAVVGCAETLRQRWQTLPEEQTTMLLDAVGRHAVRLDRLLSDLLDVDRLSRGLIEPLRSATPVGPLVRGVLETVPREGHFLRVEVPELVASVDGPKVERILENLVRNAVKHTPPGTTITVRAKPLGEGVRLEVEDDGPGVPEDLRDRLFDPFAQGPGATWSASPGTGIGLSLVASFAALHGGRARIEDGPEGGARFVVELPGPQPVDGSQTTLLSASSADRRNSSNDDTGASTRMRTGPSSSSTW